MKSYRRMRKLSELMLVAVVCVLLPLNATLSFAADATGNGTAPPQADGGSESLIKLLMEKGILSVGEAEKLIEREKLSEQKREEQDTVVIEQAKSDVKKDMKEYMNLRFRNRIKNEMTRIIDQQSEFYGPSWAQRIRFGGDFRLRWQSDNFDQDNIAQADPADPTTLLNTTNDRNRIRVRARLKATAEVNEYTTVGLRITTGNVSNPVSTNETLGDFNNKDTIVLDRAFIRLKPIPEFTFWGGRFPNPFFSTDLLFDSDLNFEGVAIGLDAWLLDNMRGFFTVGGFPLEEFEFRRDDQWLVGLQGGLELKPFRRDLTFKLGVGFYDYVNLVGKVNDPATPVVFEGPLFQQKGNTLFDIEPGADVETALASDYDILNILGSINISFYSPIEIILSGEWVKNLGFNKEDVMSRTLNPDQAEETNAYQLGLFVGYKQPKLLWDWNAFFYYKYLEADAVLDAFTDSDFRLGGTNAKGWIFGGALGLAENLWLSARYLTADEISGAPLSVDVLQVDMNTKF